MKIAIFLFILLITVDSIGWQDSFTPLQHIFSPFSAKTKNIRQLWETRNLLPKKSVSDTTPIQYPKAKNSDLNIGIIGAGLTGLYAGLILESFDNVSFTIFESDSTRVGGRICTHYFSDEKWNYGEFGAMRMPHDPEYQIIFDVIEYLNEINFKRPDLKIQLTKFILSNEQALLFVNNRFGPNGTVMTFEYASQHPEALGFPTMPNPPNIWQFLGKIMLPYIEALENDTISGLEFLSTTSEYSARTVIRNYLLNNSYTQDQAEDILDVAEVLAFGTGLLGSSFAEAVLDTFVFRATSWSTIEGGMQRFPNAFLPKIQPYLKLGAHVQEIAWTDDKQVNVTWTINNQVQSVLFDHVIITVPFPALYHMKTPSEFSFAKKKIIREMPYDPSCKALLQFSSRFWEKGPNPIYGGVSTTDLPARTLVYPSFGIGYNGSGVMIGSYTFSTDADRWAGLDENQALIEILDNVASIHGNYIKDLFVDGAIKCWHRIPTALGGYAWLNPGEFSFFADAGTPEDNIHFAGEHTSPYHGWISGALDSAKRSLKEIFNQEGWQIKKIGKIFP